MENIKQQFIKYYAKLKDLYLSMTFGNRVVATLLFATLLISLGYLITGSITPSEFSSKMTYVFNGYSFDRDQQRAAEAALAEANLRHGPPKGHQWIGDKLQVPADKLHLYVAALAAKNVTATPSTPRHETTQTFSPLHSAKIMNERMTTASEIACVAAIKMLPGIADAKVQSHRRPVWDRNVWSRTQQFSVSVAVEAIESRALPYETINAIGNIVAPSFGIINKKEIAIVDTRHSRSYSGTGEELGSTQGEYLRYTLRYEEEIEDKISKTLDKIDGMKIRASVKLTTFLTRESLNIEHGKPTDIHVHELDTHFQRKGMDRWWRPGQFAQWSPPLIDPTGEKGPENYIDDKKREMEKSSALQGTQTREEDVPYIPVEVRATIRIPREHLVDVWRARTRLFGGDLTAAPTVEELSEIETDLTDQTKRSVAKLLEIYRLSSRVDAMEFVEVLFYDLPRPDEVILTAWEKFVLFLHHNWQNLGLMSMVFSGLLVLWLISKPQKPEPIVIYEGMDTPLEAIDARLAEKLRREEEEAAAAAAVEEEEVFENSLGELGSLRTLRDEIAELIAKNPDAAAAVIKQWIGTSVLVEQQNN